MPAKIFCCYAHQDERLLNKLKAHLESLRRQNLVEVWDDRDISAGTEWKQEASKQLNTADIILLLVSSDFMYSDYCYSIEMKRALERHERGEARVIPIILRRTHWQHAPLDGLQALPTDGRPVTDSHWSTQDEAFFNIVIGISKVIEELIPSQKTRDRWLEQGIKSREVGSYAESIASFDYAIRLDPDYAQAYLEKGITLRIDDRYQEALAAFEQVIRLDPDYAQAYLEKGITHRFLKQLPEALAAFEQVTRLNPRHAYAYMEMGVVLRMLKFNMMALVLFEYAIQLNPPFAKAYLEKGITLCLLKRHHEALLAFQQTTQLDSQYAYAYRQQGEVLKLLGKDKEAKDAFEKADQLEGNEAS